MNKTHLLCSTLLISAALAVPAWAQVEAVPTPVTVLTAQDLENQSVTTVDALILTGTRLKLPDYVSPNPTVSQSAEQIERSGDASVIEFLTDLPAVVGSTTDSVAADYSTPSLVGLNLLDLRNLGETRTLVLVNGRRHVAGLPGTAAVDVNTIPMDLIERVDILTGGASAVYGADGVSGVINFILKDNFQGVTTRAQFGSPEDAGGDTTFVSLLAGRNFSNDNVNLTFGAEYYSRKDIKFNDREYTRSGVRRTFFDNPDDFLDGDDDDDIPDLVLLNDLRYVDSSPGGSIYTRYDGDLGYQPRFTYDGGAFDPGIRNGGFIQIGGSGSSLDEYNDDLVPGTERFALNLNGRWDINPRWRAFTELKYTRGTSDFVGQPSYDYGLLIPSDNPFIPANVLDDALNDPDGLDQYVGGVLVARDNFDLGRTTFDNTRDTQRLVFGVSGALRDNLDFEASYVYGRAHSKVHATNVRINERFFAAIDVVETSPGVYACRSDLDPSAVPSGDLFAQFGFDDSTFGTTFTPGPGSGCTPVNIFGLDQFNQAARDWINTDITDDAVIDQHVLTAYFTGTTDGFFTFPRGDAINYVFGGEYRRESSSYHPDELEILADTLEYPITTAGRGSITEGDFNVTEAFAEIRLPILKDLPGAKAVELTGAYRYSDYSTSGGTETWNVGGRWQINDNIMLRATRARAVRAPNINNLFRGRDQTFESLVDPCSSENLGFGENPALRLTNCTTALAAAGEVAGVYQDTSSESIGGFLAGNPDLVPETADTYTYGIVFTPKGIPGFAASIDYYNITIDDAITSYSAQTIVDNCYDLPQPNTFCDLIDRQGSTGSFPGRISDFLQIPGNIASFETSGVDFSVRYAFDPQRHGMTRDIGTFDFSLVGSFLDDLVFIETSTAAPDHDDGELGAPSSQIVFDTTWNRNNWQVNYGYSWYSETRRFSASTEEAEPDYVEPQYFKYGAHSEHDLRVSYLYDGKYNFFGGVNNLTNEQPEPQDYIYPVEPFGRYFYLGVKAEFE